LHDGDGRALRLPRHGGRRRAHLRRARGRVRAARTGAGERGLLARVDAPPARRSERSDGIPDRGDDRLGARAGRERGVAQLLRVRGVPARRGARADAAPEGRPAVPARAAAQLQPQVLPCVAPPLLLLRALDRLPARRARLPARGVAAHAAGAVGAHGGSRRALRRLLAAAALVAAGNTVLLGGAAGRGDALHLVKVGQFDLPVYVAAVRTQPTRIYVVEQRGRIRIVDGGKPLATPFLDIASQVLSGGEQGLLSVAFHPNYAENHLFYVDYTDRNGDTRVVEYRANGDQAVLSSARQLLFVKDFANNHNGGQLQFGPDGLLWWGNGDGGGG